MAKFWPYRGFVFLELLNVKWSLKKKFPKNSVKSFWKCSFATCIVWFFPPLFITEILMIWITQKRSNPYMTIYTHVPIWIKFTKNHINGKKKSIIIFTNSLDFEKQCFLNVFVENKKNQFWPWIYIMYHFV